MNLSLFDLHCDTAFEMLRTNQPLRQNRLAVSLENASVFQRYIQVMALWTAYRLDDEQGWAQCLQMIENLRADPSVRSGDAVLETEISRDATHPSLILAVEDARILAGKLDRVDQLYAQGVRILTPLWRGDTCIGGSHDSASGLTEFGKRALRHAIELGMIPDISHASVASAQEIFEIAEELARPVIASHSNAYEICPVSRNLRADQIDSVLRSNGIIGINLYQGFLTPSGTAALCDVIPHIEYFLEHGAEHALCIGGDMDGCDLPTDLPSLAQLPQLAELLLQHNYPEDMIHALFFENAYRFATRYVKN